MNRETRTRTVRTILVVLVLFDLFLVAGVALVPDLWFQVFHVDPEVTPLATLFLRRCGANWTAFFLFQAIALWRWERDAVWLAVVAGIRFSDIFTDPTYGLMSEAPTWFSLATLPAVGVTNLCLALFFLQSYRVFAAGSPDVAHDPRVE